MNPNASEPEVLSLISICSSFPEPLEMEVPRENMVSTLVGQLKRNTEIIVVEGEEGIGKTTLMSQFARTYPNQTLSAFVSDTSRYAWDPMMVAQNLHEQIQFALGNMNFRKPPTSDIHSTLRNDVAELQKKANWEKITYYFIVDGLEDVPQEESGAVDQILDLLPIGLSTFRFLLTGSMEKLSALRKGSITLKPWTLPPFSLDETVKFFRDIQVSREHFETIYKLSNKGIPGKLAAVRRICASPGSTPDQVLTNFGEHAPNLLEEEWSVVTKAPEEMHFALAAMCFDTRRHNLHTLSKLCGIEINKLKDFLDSCTFIQWIGCEKHLSFAPYFKRFAAKRLTGHRKAVLHKIIEQLMTRPESNDSLNHLPAFLNESGEYGRLLEYLSGEHFGKLVECSDSWIPLHQKADLGVATARRLNRDADLMRFALQRSAVTNLESCEERRSEIEAYVALGDLPAAYAVAQAAIAKEDRLHILAIIAAAKRKKGLTIEPELREQVRQLYDQLDKTGLGARAPEIAMDLVSWQPDLAIDLIRTSQKETAAQEDVEMAFATLSVRTMLEQTRESAPTELRAKVRAQLRDPAVQKFVDTAALLWGGYSAPEVIAMIDQWENPADRIYVMRIWAITNRHRADAAQVVQHALDTIVKTTEFAPNAKIYRELAMPLPRVPDADTAKALVARFDGVKALIEPVGPTEEFIRLQLLLAATEHRYAPGSAMNRFTDIFYSISYLKDLSTKTACLARLNSTLQTTDPNRTYDATCDVHKAAASELETCLRQLLTETADHYEAIEPAIPALTRSAPDRALDLANSLNTEPRRDRARIKILEAIASRAPESIKPPFIEKLLNAIHYPGNYDVALTKLLSGLAGHKDKVGHLVKTLLPLAEKSRRVTSPEDRCQVLLHLHSICLAHPDNVPKNYPAFLRDELAKSWRDIDFGPTKIETGFRLAADMANPAPDFAKSILEEVQKLRSDLVLDSTQCAQTYIICCRLAIRAFSGLIKKRLYSDIDINDLAELIDNIPSTRIRAYVWSELALRLYLDGQEVDCRDVVLKHVKATISKIPAGAKEERAAAIIRSASALFCGHPGTAEEIIETLDAHEKDQAYADICEFLLTRELPFDVYDRNSTARDSLEVTSIWDFCRLLHKIKNDTVVYNFMERLIDNLETKRNRNAYSREQQADIQSRLQALIPNFPVPNFIQHEGYKVLAEGQIARLERSNPSVWDALVARARSLPNHSDQAYVICKLAGAMPAKHSQKKRDLLDEVKKKIATLSSLQDRIDRYEALADAAQDFDRHISREALQLAIQDSVAIESKDIANIRKRLVDRAYRLDADFAATLASGMDDDPARMTKKQELQDRLATLKLRDSLQKGEEDALCGKSNDKPKDPEQLSEAAWMALRSLNSGKMAAIRADNTRAYVQHASTLTLSQAYWMLALVIENAVRHYKDTNEASTHLRPLFNACVMGVDLTFRIAGKIRSSASAHRLSMSIKDSTDGSLILGGERERALEKVCSWVRDKAKDFIYICDPYFGPEDLDLVQLVRTKNANIPIEILTSRKHQSDEEVSTPWEETYQAHWRLHVSESDPGEVRIVIVGSKDSGVMPIHDRWLLTAGAGLRLGSSLNSLGITKASEVTEIEDKDLPAIQALVDKHLHSLMKTPNGERLLSTTFYLA